MHGWKLGKEYRLLTLVDYMNITWHDIDIQNKIDLSLLQQFICGPCSISIRKTSSNKCASSYLLDSGMLHFTGKNEKNKNAVVIGPTYMWLEAKMWNDMKPFLKISIKIPSFYLLIQDKVNYIHTYFRYETSMKFHMISWYEFS